MRARRGGWTDGAAEEVLTETNCSWKGTIDRESTASTFGVPVGCACGALSLAQGIRNLAPVVVVPAGHVLDVRTGKTGEQPGRILIEGGRDHQRGSGGDL